MSEYGKKLHIRKSDVVTNISLYTTAAEVGSPYVVFRDGSTPLFAPLCATSDGDASPLRIRRSGTVYAVKKIAIVHGNKMITSNTTFVVPAGVTKLTVTGSAGGGSSASLAESLEDGSWITTDGGRGANTTIGSYLTLTGGAGGATYSELQTTATNGTPYVNLPSNFSNYGKGGIGDSQDYPYGEGEMSTMYTQNGGHGGTCLNTVITVTPNQTISVVIGAGANSAGQCSNPGTAGFVYLSW